MGTTGLDQQSLDQAVVLTYHPSDSPAPSSGVAWAGTTEVSRPHWAEQMVPFVKDSLEVVRVGFCHDACRTAALERGKK
jgi:hypothetical protein